VNHLNSCRLNNSTHNVDSGIMTVKSAAAVTILLYC
jgi:hypothetical protein